MPSVARHLLFLGENEQKEIPRCARDDTVEVFSVSLMGPPCSPFCFLISAFISLRLYA